MIIWFHFSWVNNSEWNGWVTESVMFNFLRKSQQIFQPCRECTAAVKAPVVPHVLQHLVLSHFFNFLLLCMKQFLFVGFLMFLIKCIGVTLAIRLYMFQVYISMIHHLYIACVPTTQGQIIFCHHIFAPFYPSLHPHSHPLW